MLRGTASRVGPLALRLREGACYFFQDGAHLKLGGAEGSVNDTTPGKRKKSPSLQFVTV